jgi:hypothetical protein
MDEVLNIQLSNGQRIDYPVNDQPFTSLCDYMDTCKYECINILKGPQKIDKGTYRYKDTWNDKIIPKIKELFYKKHVYRRDELLTNLKRSGTIEEIERVLYDMLETRTPIVDKFSKRGYLTRIADLYLFQPLELEDPHLTTHDRMTPVAKKPTEFTLENTAVSVSPEKDNLVLRSIIEKFERANTPVESGKPPDEWYGVYYIAGEHMKGRGVSDKKIHEYLISHICDELTFQEELDLLNYLFSTTELTPLERDLKSYYDKNVKQKEDVIGILLYENEKEAWYTFNDVMIGIDNSKVWIPSTYSDKMILETTMVKPKQKFNKFYGFLGLFHDKYVFKVKLSADLKSRGANVEQKSRSQIISLLNETLDEKDLYTKENTKSLNQICLVVIEELLLRSLDETKGKRYFLSKNEYYLNKN